MASYEHFNNLICLQVYRYTHPDATFTAQEAWGAGRLHLKYSQEERGIGAGGRKKGITLTRV